MNFKEKFFKFYEENETRVDIAFFLGGFIFDVFTLSDIDDPVALAQQVLYFLIIGSIVFYEFLFQHGKFIPTGRVEKLWPYRQIAVHFLLGSLLSVYSLFFLKSSSIFSSIVFVIFLAGLMIANEMKSVQKSKVDLKIGLLVICLFSFFSMIIPVLLGFVGWIPFLLSLFATMGFLFGARSVLLKRTGDSQGVFRFLIAPGGTVCAVLLIFYIIGWIPPVPLSVKKMGIYHNIEKADGKYLLSHEKPWWKFWHEGDQDFNAVPGDRIYFFASIFSPARFSDSVILNWNFYDPTQGWSATDRVPMRISGGREEGFRGFSNKQNYAPGKWRVSVETTDGREIGRIYFTVTEVAPDSGPRQFEVEWY
ncbi:MAG: DUF2914 domain-containing protein [Pseudobdellovibrionaceae bacterium]